MIECKICGYIADSQLTTHLKKCHNLCSKEYKQRYNAQVLSPEALSRLIERNKSDKQRKIISERNRDPEFIKKCIDGIHNSEKFKKSIGEATAKRNKEVWTDPIKSQKLKEQMSKSAKIRANTPEYKQRCSELSKRIWNDPILAERMLNAPRKSLGNSQYYYSEIFRKMYYCRSAGELEFIHAMEFINASSLDIEPVRIQKEDGGIYIPDFLVTLNDIQYLVEIKFNDYIENYKLKVQSALKYCSEHNLKFCWIRRFIELPQIYDNKSLDFCVISNAEVR